MPITIFLLLQRSFQGAVPDAVADYLLTKAIPEDLKGALPTIEEIEDEFMR